MEATLVAAAVLSSGIVVSMAQFWKQFPKVVTPGVFIRPTDFSREHPLKAEFTAPHSGRLKAGTDSSKVQLLNICAIVSTLLRSKRGTVLSAEQLENIPEVEFALLVSRSGTSSNEKQPLKQVAKVVTLRVSRSGMRFKL